MTRPLTASVDYTRPPDRPVTDGRDLEVMALARAVRWRLDHRVLHIGTRTVAVR